MSVLRHHARFQASQVSGLIPHLVLNALRIPYYRIDCSGVIERLGTLFYGKPTLLEGFNMFLPRGYRIDISTDPRNPNPIMVTTPQGIKIQNAAPPESYQG